MKAMDPLLIDVPERLQTARLLLRRPLPGDGAALCEAVRVSLDELRPWMPWAQTESSVDEAETTVRRMHAQFALREDLPMFMFERDAGGEGALVGCTGLHRIDWSVPRFEIGYWRRSGLAGRGLVSEAVRTVCRMAFESLGAQRVEIRMDDRNEASRRVAERAGFSFEGLLRQDTMAVDGVVRDTRVYSRVRGVEVP
jgi:RimJ/RimL family protein N-acetyltransferase